MELKDMGLKDAVQVLIRWTAILNIASACVCFFLGLVLIIVSILLYKPWAAWVYGAVYSLLTWGITQLCFGLYLRFRGDRLVPHVLGKESG